MPLSGPVVKAAARLCDDATVSGRGTRRLRVPAALLLPRYNAVCASGTAAPPA